ncbi:hypothetical protein NUU61_008219 [Penicillium alfredii]|uniref:Siderophore biosynthesis enzyme n=1 Tax=Penicillium alfredii TaxID=1506179 RepID=A0A9W9JZU1_9EURO|nr:uncharacterized protein NUU61_008219 [Penicillium alfredii]KAJ5086912.1 hypothetical protein NUU61_008219 [Penicillium alfredii]
MKAVTLPLLLSLAGLSVARTDLGGCVSSQTTNQWHEASMIWYVPNSGEICDIPDCGGGRAPPKTNQPGCPLYTGTETLTPSYLPGWGPNGKAVPSTTAVAETSSTEAAQPTDSSSSSAAAAPPVLSPPRSKPAAGHITPAPVSTPLVTMTKTTSSGSTDSPPVSGSNPDYNAAAMPASNVAGVVAVVAAVIGAMAL